MYVIMYVIMYSLFLRYLDITTTHTNWPLPTFSTPGKHWSCALTALPPDATASARNAVVSACGIAWETALSFLQHQVASQLLEGVDQHSEDKT